MKIFFVSCFCLAVLAEGLRRAPVTHDSSAVKQCYLGSPKATAMRLSPQKKSAFVQDHPAVSGGASFRQTADDRDRPVADWRQRRERLRVVVHLVVCFLMVLLFYMVSTYFITEFHVSLVLDASQLFPAENCTLLHDWGKLLLRGANLCLKGDHFEFAKFADIRPFGPVHAMIVNGSMQSLLMDGSIVEFPQSSARLHLNIADGVPILNGDGANVGTISSLDAISSLDDVNNLHGGHEGTYPPEFENPWVIFTIKRCISNIIAAKDG